MLPLAPERAESHGFEYKRNGILSLFAALNTAPGEVISKTAARQASEQFVAFLQELLASQPGQREIHVMCDDVSSQKTELTQTFLAEHGQVRIQYTPAYSARLNQEENWFSRIRRDVIAHCLFTSVKDLDKKQYAKSARTRRSETNQMELRQFELSMALTLLIQWTMVLSSKQQIVCQTRIPVQCGG